MKKTSKTTKKTSPRIAAYILAFMAFVFTSVGGAFTWFSYDFSYFSVATTGTVIDMSISHSDNSTTYKPTIAFVDLQGNKHSGQTFLSSSSYNYERGAQVEILYDMRDPRSLRIDSWFALWGFGFIFLGVGLVLTAITLILWRKGKAAKPKATGSKPYRSKRADKFESTEDHKRETEYTPTVRRR